MSISRKGWTPFRRCEVTKPLKSLHPSIRVGAFAIAEDEIIIDNWNNLITWLGPNSPITECEDKVTTEIFENVDKGLGLKRNIVGYYLAKGLENICLATEVIHRAKTLLTATREVFSPEEDKIIEKFVEEKGEKW